MEYADLVECITVMVQKEVGERFAALPGSGSYSALSVEGQYLFTVRKLFTVPGRSFNPSPNVDSVIIQFEKKKHVRSVDDMNSFFSFVRACFKQRRKTIFNNMKEFPEERAVISRALKKADIAETSRPQQLSVDEMITLYEAYYEIKSICKD